ncbi:MAG: aminotransferase class I/II-fold pyridoxal phosphate-dependent enzyme [Hyphomonadaceae bacterium]|nr:aminotransferase class I/II-fold pyridoxal phosphate-dependent enzyme [Hyphomonadaceae bacterium]
MEVAREANARAAAGERIVRFDVGQPWFGAPAAALAAAERAMRSEALGYTEGLGAMALRKGISSWYASEHGLDIDPARIVVTTGASGAFTLAFLALFDDGARVAIASPGYPPYRHILKALGYEAVVVDADVVDHLQLTPALLEQAGDFDGALVASPANPTGAMLSRDALQALCAAMRAAGKPLISDEIYHGLTYDGPATSALAFDDDVIVVNSFSKYWAMTGWRVGWIVAPPRLVKSIEKLAQNLTVAPPTVSQVAALGALTAKQECEERRALYAANRTLLLRELPALKLPPVVSPDGAFYVLVDVSAHTDDSMALSHRLLEETGVAITPGIDFCAARGRHWARLAFCRPQGEIEDGLARLRRHL